MFIVPIGAALVAALAAAPCMSAPGDILLVPRDYATIQEAIDAAKDGDEIYVGPGRYRENLDLRGKSVLLEAAGTDADHPAFVDGAYEFPVLAAMNHEPATTIVRGFTLSAGSGLDVGGIRRGGGIYIDQGASPTIEGNRIIDCEADLGGAVYVGAGCSPTFGANEIVHNLANYGGGVYSAGAPTFDRQNLIDYNWARRQGGGFYLTGDGASIRDNLITANFSDAGGGIQIHRGSPTVTDNWLEGNSAGSGEGGGIGITGGSAPSLRHNRITQNLAGVGGGLYAWASSPSIVANTMDVNHAATGPGIGGGVALGQCAGLFEGNLVTGNDALLYGGGLALRGETSIRVELNDISWNTTAAGAGGGIFVQGRVTSVVARNEIYSNRARFGGGLYARNGSSKGALRIQSSLIDHNQAEIGGGLFMTGVWAIVEGCTLATNAASVEGGGLYARTPIPYGMSIDSSILWGNDAPVGDELSADVIHDLSVRYCDVEGIDLGGTNLSLDPLFNDPGMRDYEIILSTSPAIDGGNPITSLHGQLDLVGDDRVKNFVIDMGAYEF